MNTRFYNGKILSMEKGFDIADCELWVQNDEVYYIGNGDREIIKFDREIDLDGNLLMPGFKNAHTHSAMTFLRSYADDLPLEQWLNKAVFPMEDKLQPGDIYWLSKLAVMEYLTSGITCCMDMYLNDAEMTRACMECGYRVMICGALNDFTGSLEQAEDSYKRYNDYSELVGYQFGFHAEYTTNIELLKGLAGLSEKYEAPVFTHCSETITEVEECKKRYGVSPVQLFEQLNMLNFGGGLYHGVYLNDDDMEIVKKRGVSIITNPGSNCKLASGIAPIIEMHKKGINIAIGTDGPASNNALDMFREMYLTSVLQKVRENDAAALSAEDVLYMAITGGAKAMRLEDCDNLAVGKKADLTVIDMHRPNMQPINNIVKNIVYSGSKDNILLTMVNGKILYEKGEWYINEDIEKIYYMANKIISDKRYVGLSNICYIDLI